MLKGLLKYGRAVANAMSGKGACRAGRAAHAGAAPRMRSASACAPIARSRAALAAPPAPAHPADLLQVQMAPTMLFKFTSPKDVDMWHTFTDSAFGGRSTATMHLSPAGDVSSSARPLGRPP
jgi:hypothetical protein